MTREEALNYTKSELKAAYDRAEKIGHKGKTRYIEILEMAIKALEQGPRKGHWIFDDSDNSVICDKCGCTLYPNDILHGEAHFCPNCGADMRGEK